MMPASMDALAGMRLLLAGDDRAAVGALRAAVALRAPLRPPARAIPPTWWRSSPHDPPAAVVAIGGNAAALRERLDPLGLEGGPEVAGRGSRRAGRAFDGAPPRGSGDRRAPRAARTPDRARGVVAAQAVARRRHDELAALDTLRRLALAAEYRDDNTHEHTQRVGELAARLARHLGHEDRTVWLIREVAPLHDLGKIAIPDTVLLKPGKLTREEFEVVKTHAVLGARVLAGGESDLLRAAERVVALAPRALGRHRLPRRPAPATTSRSRAGSSTSRTCSTSSSTSARTRSRGPSRPPRRRSGAAPARSSIPRSCARSRPSEPAPGKPTQVKGAAVGRGGGKGAPGGTTSHRIGRTRRHASGGHQPCGDPGADEQRARAAGRPSGRRGRAARRRAAR